MTKITLFVQIIQQLPKDLIKSLIKKHGTDKHWLTRSFVGTSLQAMKPYKSVNRLWERERRTDDEVSGFIICKPIQLIQRFRDFCQKKLPDFNTSATCHLSAGTAKKAFALPILMPFDAQSDTFIGSKHSNYAVKA